MVVGNILAPAPVHLARLAGEVGAKRRVRVPVPYKTLTRLAALGDLSRKAEELYGRCARTSRSVADPVIPGGDIIASPERTIVLLTKVSIHGFLRAAGGKDVDADPGLRQGRLCVGMTAM